MPPIAVTLEHDRLRYREARLQRALTVLEARAENLETHGQPVPSPLFAAISGFRSELETTRRRLP
jgi:hypothetical protein